MMKKFILALATISLLGILPSCTSKDSKNEDVIAEDGTAEDMAGDAGIDSLDESLDSEQSGETVTSPDAATEPAAPVAETTTEDQLTIDSFGETADSAATTEPVPDANAQASADPTPPMTTEPAANDLAMEAPSTGAEEMTPPASMEKVAEAAPEQMEQKDETDLDLPKPSRTLQKMASSPWKMGSKWVNGIYFARPGDSLESISQTLYGDDRTSELKKINPTYANREVKPGDKVYYASVVRPEDNAQIMTYFEEKNVPAKTYISKSGDNIRKVSQELLGYPEAWKEVWAYNSVESKQDIGEGIELRYWEAQPSSGSAPIADQAAPEMPSIPEAPPMAPPAEDPMAQLPPPSQELPPPPDMNNMAGNDLPPPPPPMDAPPPPPSMDMAPPPPPPPPASATQASVDDAATTEQDTNLAVGAVGAMVLGALALIMVRRKRKQREMEQALGETHVG